MKLAIVNPIHRRFSGGYYKYLGEIVPRLAADPRVGQLTLWLPEDAQVPALDAVRIVRWPGGASRRGLQELRARLDAAAPDVVFVPTARHVDAGRAPVVVMVRNMEPLRVPLRGNDPGEAVRNLLRAAVARRACQRAARVIAVSQHVREFLTTRWRIPDERIGVVYHGVAPHSPGMAAGPVALPARTGSFLFTAGSLRAARGLEDAIGAMPAVLRADPASTLVVAGRWDPGSTRYRRRIMRLIDRLQVGHSIVWAGQLEPPAVAWCLEHADVFVMTSRAEACPNTALEALAAGCRIASTRQAPMPEFLGDAVEYYEPGSADGLAAAILALRAEAIVARERRRAAAVAQAARFTWGEAASATIAQLLQVCAGSPVARAAR